MRAGMIVLAIPRKVGGRDLREFILNQVRKFRHNQRHKHIKLQGEVAYSRDFIYFVFPDRALELAFALSVLLKCQEHNVPCNLGLSRPVKLEELPREVLEAARVWCRGKLRREYYKLRGLALESLSPRLYTKAHRVRTAPLVPVNIPSIHLLELPSELSATGLF